MRTHVDQLVQEMKSGRMISVLKSDPLSQAFQLLVENGVSSVPVYNPSKQAFTAFLDYVDLVTLVVRELPEAQLSAPAGASASAVLSSGKLATLTCEAAAGLSNRNPYLPVDQHAPLLRVVELMVQHRAPRVPVIDGENRLLCVLTETGVLQFLHKHLAQLERASKTVAELNLNSGPYVSIQKDQKAIDAFRLIQTQSVTGVAVLDGSKLVGHISASDLKLVGKDANFLSLLFSPAASFLKLTGFREPVAVTSASTLREVVETAVKAHVHAVYVIDNGKMQGVITLSLLLRALHHEHHHHDHPHHQQQH